ncbi:MAG: ABC transporter ATP-binding protein [Pseudomonadota bacterium]
MAEVKLSGIRKSFGPTEVIKGVDLDIPHRSFCVFVGPSGCGKSTLLRMIAGLEDITDGSLEIGGREMIDVAPAKRGVAMVFQSYALYPHMSVADNVTFGLRMANHPQEDTERRCHEAARMLKLDALLDRKPSQLSGGQRQRVAIGRAIVRNPDVFLFDEPLSNLDAALRVEMRAEIIRLHANLDATMIYVTHDQVEAMTMADMIVVLDKGIIEQVGSPLDLYHEPNTLFVARFMGSPQMNTFAVDLSDAGGGQVSCALPGGASIKLDGSSLRTGKATFGIRPEHLEVAPEGELNGKAVLCERLGSETLLHVDIGLSHPIVVKADGLTDVQESDRVGLKLNPKACHLFGPDDRRVRSGSLQ